MLCDVVKVRLFLRSVVKAHVEEECRDVVAFWYCFVVKAVNVRGCDPIDHNCGQPIISQPNTNDKFNADFRIGAIGSFRPFTGGATTTFTPTQQRRLQTSHVSQQRKAISSSGCGPARDKYKS